MLHGHAVNGYFNPSSADVCSCWSYSVETVYFDCWSNRSFEYVMKTIGHSLGIIGVRYIKLVCKIDCVGHLEEQSTAP